jgi:PAT family beta-lactamase induction signal transducer AmpG
MARNAARRLPVWIMGLANCSTGFVYGFISTAMGILLVSRGVSVGRVGAISAIAFSPTFWAWLLAPVLDVRFTKKAYAYVFSALAATLLGVALLCIGNLELFTAFLTASCAAAVLYSNAVQSWAPDIVSAAEYDAMGGWFNVANLGAAGVFGALTIVAVRALPLPVAAAVLALIVFAPAMLLLRFPVARRPEGTLRANFASMAHDLRRVLREGRVWIGLMIFLAPIAFAMTNLFSSLGDGFGASERTVTTLNGPGVAIVCSLGCLLAIPLCKYIRRRTVYLLAGGLSAVAAVAMGVLPHTVGVYVAGVLAYNFLQGFNYATFTALELEIVGPQNAISGTMIAMLSASQNVPISTMTWIDSKVHDSRGLRAMLFTDATASVVTAIVLFAVALPLVDRYMLRRRPAMEPVK